MPKPKGLVLEVKEKHVVVLTGDGRFLKIYYKGKLPEIGSEIDVRENSFNWKVWSMAGIAALLIVIIIPLLILQFTVIPQEVVAYVTVDINPSIELGLNKEDKVISVNPLNEDGRKLLEKLELEELSVERALELITEAAIQEKYITEEKENAVIISYSKKENINNTDSHNNPEKIIATQEAKNIEKLQSDPVTVQNEEELQKRVELQKKVMEVVQRNQQKAVVEIIHVSSELRDQAKQLGLSPGKYSLMLEALDEGVEISPEKVRENSIVTAIEEAGGDLGQIIIHIQQRSNELELDENGLLLTEPSLENSRPAENTSEDNLTNNNFNSLTEPPQKEAVNFNEEMTSNQGNKDIEQQKEELFESMEIDGENFIENNQNEKVDVQKVTKDLEGTEEITEIESETIKEGKNFNESTEQNSKTQDDNELLDPDNMKQDDKEKSEGEKDEKNFLEKENSKENIQADNSDLDSDPMEINSEEEESENSKVKENIEEKED